MSYEDELRARDAEIRAEEQARQARGEAAQREALRQLAERQGR